ncbi:MAG: FAD-dependent oxidoreductase [Kiloniellales bacterium]
MRDASLGPALRVAVVGSGAAGLAAAWALSQRHDVVLYEADERLGGHANTVSVQGPKGEIAVDTGFIVYNEPAYPNLVRFLDQLGVATHASDMSFAVSLGAGRYEYAGSPLGLFAQTSNLASPSHWRLISDTLRFFREARALLAQGQGSGNLASFLQAGGYSQAFQRRHLLPMAAAIWSATPGEILAFPLATFLRFFDNHGLLQSRDRPQWRTVTGGSRSYVEAVARSLGPARLRLGSGVAAVRPALDGVSLVDTAGFDDRFDQVVLACHADQALALLGKAALPQQRELLSCFRYSDNRALLHSDPALMPRRRRVWSSWNYMARDDQGEGPLSVSYWMNRLQGLDEELPLFVSLNPLQEPRPELLHGSYSYSHPLFDAAAIGAQSQLSQIQGLLGLWFCGSYCGYGFHEDAMQAGFTIATALGAPPPWHDRISPRSPAADLVAHAPLSVAAE